MQAKTNLQIGTMDLAYRILFFVVLIFSLSACDERKWNFFGMTTEEKNVRLHLSTVDSLMESNPQSAMDLLRKDSTIVPHCSKETRMLYALLKTQAEDKLYIPHRSDSIMQEVVDYYSTHGNARLQAQACFLLGRVSYDLHHISSAMSAWKNVLVVEGEEPIVNRYKTRAFSWLGSIYEKEKIYEKLLACNLQAYYYAKRSDSAKELMLYSLRNIGRSYSYLKNNKKAILYYKKSLDLAKEISDSDLYLMIEEELSAIYIEEGMLQEAGKILLRPVKWTFEEDLAPFYYTKGEYYEAMGNIDSAVFYYQKNIAIASMYSKTLTVARLVALFDKLGNHIEARKYRELGKVYEDSLTLQRQAEVQDNDKNMAKNVKIQKQNVDLTHNKRVIIFDFCLLGTVLIGIIFFVCHKYQRKKKQLSNENKRTTEYWQWKHKQDMSKIQEVQGQVSKLQNELRQKLRQTIKDEAFVLQSRIHSKENLDIVKELGKSKIYTSFSNAKYKPSQEDFLQLENVLNCVYENFTERLKLYYPQISKEERVT